MPEMVERLRDQIPEVPSSQLDLREVGPAGQLRMQAPCPHCPQRHETTLQATQATELEAEEEFAGAELPEQCPETGRPYQALLSPRLLRDWHARQRQSQPTR